jgi:hypothetical protein
LLKAHAALRGTDLFGEGALVSNLEFVFRLPDFIFERERAAEEAYGFTLAGKLVTDIPRHSEPGEGDRQLISEIVGELTRLARRDPGLQEASIWRGCGKPPDALESPFPDAAVRARLERCIVVGVRVDRNAPDGFIRVDDTLMADIMGRHSMGERR